MGFSNQCSWKFIGKNNPPRSFITRNFTFGKAYYVLFRQLNIVFQFNDGCYQLATHLPGFTVKLSNQFFSFFRVFVITVRQNDAYLSQLFHHEISSVFLRDYPFPSEAWAAVNSKSFARADTDVLNAIDNNGGDDNSEHYFYESFLSNYGYPTLENDFNLYAEMAFTDPETLNVLADIHPRIRQKLA